MLQDIKIFNDRDFPAYLPRLNSLYDDLFHGGKGFRALLVQRIGSHLQTPDSTIKLLCQTIEFIHNASLLHDDLVDRSHLRRGKTSAWLKYTPEYAVLAGDYLLARVMVNLSAFGNIKLVQYTAEIISDLLEGEWLQDSLIRDFSVDLSQLDRVHNLKTASLFKWCLRAPFIAGENYDAKIHTLLEEMGTLLGQLFQRSDDLLDFNVRNYEGKALMGDLKSGYVNSFAAFASRGLNSSALKNCQSLEDFKAYLGGDEIFENKVKEFDEKNAFLIQLYEHHIKALESSLQGSQKKLVSELEPLTNLLYWRKKSQ